MRLEQREWGAVGGERCRSRPHGPRERHHRCAIRDRTRPGQAPPRPTRRAAARGQATGPTAQAAHRILAQLWLALGDPEQATHHALTAYRWAWADGEPYVHRYELTRSTELLQQMNVPIPNLPPYDPAKDEPFPWEADVRAAIEKLKAEKEAKEAND